MNGGGGSHGIQIKPRLRGRGPFYPNSLSFTVSYHKAPDATRLLTAFVRERNILLKLEAAAAAAQARLLCPAHQLSEAPQRPQRGLLSGPQTVLSHSTKPLEQQPGNLSTGTPCCEGPQRESLESPPPSSVPECFWLSARCVHDCRWLLSSTQAGTQGQGWGRGLTSPALCFPLTMPASLCVLLTFSLSSLPTLPRGVTRFPPWSPPHSTPWFPISKHDRLFWRRTTGQYPKWPRAPEDRQWGWL